MVGEKPETCQFLTFISRWWGMMLSPEIPTLLMGKLRQDRPLEFPEPPVTPNPLGAASTKMDPLRYPPQILLTRRAAFRWDCPKGGRHRAKPAEPTPAQICFHGAPPAELWGPWGGCSNRMEDAEPPNAHPMGVGSQGWLSPKGTTSGMSPPSLPPPPGRSEHPVGLSTTLHAPQDPCGGKVGP